MMRRSLVSLYHQRRRFAGNAATSVALGRRYQSTLPWKPELVVFDQHGTLVDIHSKWEPWTREISQRLEIATGLALQEKIYKTLDICHFTKKIRHGVLGQGTSSEIKHYLQRLLHREGLSWQQAQITVENKWEDCPPSGYVDKDARNIFEGIKASGAKIALCSADDRRTTYKTLEDAGLLSLVDYVSSGDDHRMSGESPIQEICDNLRVEPQKSVIIGDTIGDMENGRQANVGLAVGVLSGISTRLNLTDVADVVTEDVSSAVNYINSLSVNDMNHISQTRTQPPSNKGEAGCVIFDKDGTLLCFHTLWTPFAEIMVKNLEAATGLSIREKVLNELGFCTTRQLWRPAVFTEGTTKQSVEAVADLLEEEGMDRERAIEVTKDSWPKSQSENPIRALDCPASIFKALQAINIKVAVCTSDCRVNTEEFLEQEGALDFVDMIVCGNDPNSFPKPHPSNALKICEGLGVLPAKTVMVGDTATDMELARAASLGASIAVLTGVGDIEHLAPGADHMVPSVSHVIDVVIAEGRRQQVRDIYDNEMVELSS